MSRVGKQPIALPKGVKVTVNGRDVNLEGPKGKLSIHVDEMVSVKAEADQVVCELVRKDHPEGRARFGLTRNLINNMVKGVAEGFRKEMEINGVGYRANLKGRE